MLVAKKTGEGLAISGLDDIPLQFANFARVLHTEHNFEIDFCQLGPATGDLTTGQVTLKPKGVTRIAIPVSLMPRFIAALTSNLEQHRRKYGVPEELVSEAATAKEDSSSGH